MVQVTAGTTGGTGATDLGKAEDAASASGQTGIPIIGVRSDSLGVTTDTDGDYTMITASQRGALYVTPSGNAVGDAQSATSLAVYDNGGSARALAVYPYSYNGTNIDRMRGNTEQTVGITASGVTTTQTGTDQTNYNARGLYVVFDMTNVGTGSVTLSIQGKAPTANKYFTILAGAAVVTNSTNVYTVYPGNTVAANVSASTVLPRTWRILCTANNANATTYTVEAMLIL